MSTTLSTTLLSTLTPTVKSLIQEFHLIGDERKSMIRQLSDFIQARRGEKKNVRLNFICVHNSRRSHISQIWAQTAAAYYRIENVETFSGGAEATAFHPNAVKAMQTAGFDIRVKSTGSNPLYDVRYLEGSSPLTVFSKTFDDPVNPNTDFAAVMVCAPSDKNCPFVAGASTRISLTFDDPKDFDGTPQESEKYLERVREIGREILFAFSLVKNN